MQDWEAIIGLKFWIYNVFEPEIWKKKNSALSIKQGKKQRNKNRKKKYCNKAKWGKYVSGLSTQLLYKILAE